MTTGTLKIRITSAGAQRTLAVTKVTATLGSASHADVRVAHPSIDAEHARLWLEGGRLWLQDLDSRHGTFLNGTRLPALKPMLVRPTDVLKLGLGEEELAFSIPTPSPVRAPRVSAGGPAVTPAVPEMTVTDIRPSPLAAAPAAETGAAREERARVARELAEMRLQLQMADLERAGVEDLRKHVNQLRETIRGLEDDDRELTSELARRRNDEAERRRVFEADLADRRATAEREISEMRDVQGRKLGHWKLDSVGELNRQTHGVLIEKVRAWVTRPLSHDMVLELEHELDGVFRAVLLEEDPHGGAVGEVTRTQVTLPPEPGKKSTPARAAESGQEPTLILPKPAASQMRLAIGTVIAPRSGTPFRRVVTRGLMVAVLGLGVEVYRLTHAPAPVGPARTPSAQSWRPVQDLKLKNRYVEDVVYTKGYAELLTSAGWRSSWTAELERAAGAWKIDARAITRLAERDVSLVAELRAMRDRTPEGQQDGALLEMRAREASVLRLMLADVGGNAAVLAKYQALRRSVLARLLPH